MTANLNFTPINDVPNGDCMICLTPLSGKLTGHGSHVYHIDCIARWVRNNPTCPLCQAAVNADTVFAQQSLYTKAQQTLQSFDFEGVACNLYEKAKPHLFIAIPYVVGYGISALGETLCVKTGSPSICASVLILKTVIHTAGIALSIYDLIGTANHGY